MTQTIRARSALCTLLLVLLAGCGDDPVAVELQVIEEVEFAASLGIDLAMFTELPSGVYVQDVVVGTGDPVVAGDAIAVGYTGYITDGSSFDAGVFPFTVGGGGTIQGMDSASVACSSAASGASSFRRSSPTESRGSRASPPAPSSSSTSLSIR